MIVFAPACLRVRVRVRVRVYLCASVCPYVTVCVCEYVTYGYGTTSIYSIRDG